MDGRKRMFSKTANAVNTIMRGECVVFVLTTLLNNVQAARGPANGTLRPMRSFSEFQMNCLSCTGYNDD